MNNIDVANGIIFQKMNISKDTFEDRLIAQKKVYLLQASGVDLGYRYNWYVRGPYSPMLSNYLYTNLEMLITYDFSKYSLTETVNKVIQKVNDVVKLQPKELTTPAWYELLASLLYMDENRESWQIKDKDSLFDTLTKYKPQYNSAQCEQAFKVLEANSFVKAGNIK